MSNIKELNVFSFENATPDLSVKTVYYSRTKESTLTHTSKKIHHFKANLGVTANFQGSMVVATKSVGLSFGFEYGYQDITADTESETNTESISVESKVPLPGYTRKVVRFYQVEEKMDLAYSGLLHTEYEDGSSSETRIDGKLKGVLVSAIAWKVGEYGYFGPTASPTATPTQTPTDFPTMIPTMIPTQTASEAPSDVPSMIPSMTPSMIPSKNPTRSINSNNLPDQPSPGSSGSAVVLIGNFLRPLMVSATIVLCVVNII